MTFSYLTIAPLILMVPLSLLCNLGMLIWGPYILTVSSPVFDWQLTQWSVLCLCLCRISASHLGSLKWFKIAFELGGGGHSHTRPLGAFSLALIPKWHSNMLVIHPRFSPTLSHLLSLQMLIFCSVWPTGAEGKTASINFSETAFTNACFLDHLVYLCCWPVQEVSEAHLLARHPQITGWNPTSYVYNTNKYGEHAKHHCDGFCFYGRGI